MDTHFNPPYDPWDQRLCMVPNGDLFRAIRDGRASVATDTIATFTENGILLDSGRELSADIIITATGLNVQAFGGIPMTVDGHAIDLAETIAYRGMMLSSVPNYAFVVSYTNLSWTLKVGLLCEQSCNLLAHMDSEATTSVCRASTMPRGPPSPSWISTRAMSNGSCMSCPAG